MSDDRSIEVLEGIIRQMHVVCKHKQTQIDALRGFAQDIMESWPESGIDGDELERAAIKYELVKMRPCTTPCKPGCCCTDYYDEEEFAAGIPCYRYTKLLKGDEK